MQSQRELQLREIVFLIMVVANIRDIIRSLRLRTTRCSIYGKASIFYKAGSGRGWSPRRPLGILRMSVGFGTRYTDRTNPERLRRRGGDQEF